MLSIADVRDLVARFQNTATGKMSQDPQLKPFIQRVYGAANEAMAEAKDRIGLSLPELLDLPQGELTVALVAPEGARPEVVALLDVGDRMSSARKVIDRAIEALDKSGSKKTEETIDGTKLVVYDTNGGGIRQVVLFEKDNTVCFSSNLAIIKAMLAVWSGKQGRTLADNDRYATIASRCRGAADQPPQIMVYADPVAFLKSMAMENPGMAMTVAMLPVLGVDGLLGVGASMTYGRRAVRLRHARPSAAGQPANRRARNDRVGVGRHDAGAVGSQQRGPLRDAALGLPEDGQEGGGGLRQLRRRERLRVRVSRQVSRRRPASTSRRSCSRRSTVGRRSWCGSRTRSRPRANT